MLVARLMEPWVIALLSLVGGAFLGAISKAIWFGRNAVTKDDLTSHTTTMASEVHELRKIVVGYRDELKNAIDSESRMLGETISALREKINKVELEASQIFVRRDSWHKAMDQMQISASKSDEFIGARIDKLESKIDRLTDRLPAPKH
jgi:chromosome segregation ATPase